MVNGKDPIIFDPFDEKNKVNNMHRKLGLSAEFFFKIITKS